MARYVGQVARPLAEQPRRRVGSKEELSGSGSRRKRKTLAFSSSPIPNAQSPTPVLCLPFTIYHLPFTSTILRPISNFQYPPSVRLPFTVYVRPTINEVPCINDRPGAFRHPPGHRGASHRRRGRSARLLRRRGRSHLY